MIVVLVNSRSRAARKNPQLRDRLARAVGDGGQVIAPPSLEALDDEARSLARSPPAVLAIHGGDGTLHRTLTALVHAFGEQPLPPIAILGGGTMNVVPTSLGIRARAFPMLDHLRELGRSGTTPAVIRRRCVRVGDQYGFIFGNGVLANFLVEYYAGQSYGPARAVWLIGRVFCSALVRGPFVKRVFKRFRGRVVVDGNTLQFPDLMAIGAGTVREVGLGFKLLQAADDDPERFAVLAIHAGAMALAPDLLAVRFGRGIAPTRAYSSVASDLEITPAEPDSPYTIDGDLYRAQGPLRISVGPAVSIVDPRSRSRNGESNGESNGKRTMPRAIAGHA